MTTHFSIVIPHYSKQRTLRLVHEELRLQLDPSDEIIIVDDHSPDGVPDFNCKCTTVVMPKKRPHIYRLNTLRNLGVHHAAHDAIIILDPDCVPNPKFLDNARSLFDPSIVYGGTVERIHEHPDTRVYKLGSIRLDPRGVKDKWNDGTFNISGGCMMFSKYRTKLFGWFNTDYDGAWGPDDTDFVMRCHHSGIRQRYSPSMRVYHIWHPKTHHKGPSVEANVKRYKENIDGYRGYFNTFTKYRPAVGVMVITMMRPELIDQCLRGVFTTNLPLKVRLVNNGDGSQTQRAALKPWKNRWAVDIVNHKERKWPAVIRNESILWAKKNQFKYLLMIDDDAVPKQGSIIKLVKVLEEHEDVYAVSGYEDNARMDKETRLGGVWKDGVLKMEPINTGLKFTDAVSGGFTLTRVDPYIPWDESYETGLNDYDWSLTLKEKGWKLASSGDAGMWHQYLFTPNGREIYHAPREYNEIRYDQERHLRMDDKFFKRWGFSILRGMRR